MRKIKGVVLLLSFLSSAVTLAAEVNVNTLMPLAKVQEFVTGSTLVAKPDKPDSHAKYLYVDKQWPVIPIVTIHVKTSGNPAKDLKDDVDLAAKWMGLKSVPLSGVGEEAYHEPQMNTIYFRKGNKVVIVGAGKDTGAIKVRIVDLCKALAQKL